MAGRVQEQLKMLSRPSPTRLSPPHGPMDHPVLPAHLIGSLLVTHLSFSPSSQPVVAMETEQ